MVSGNYATTIEKRRNTHRQAEREGGGGREREGGERDRETDRQADRQRQSDRQTDRGGGGRRRRKRQTVREPARSTVHPLRTYHYGP